MWRLNGPLQPSSDDAIPIRSPPPWWLQLACPPQQQPRYISTHAPFLNAPASRCMIIAVGFVVSASQEDQLLPPGVSTPPNTGLCPTRRHGPPRVGAEKAEMPDSMLAGAGSLGIGQADFFGAGCSPWQLNVLLHVRPIAKITQLLVSGSNISCGLWWKGGSSSEWYA